MTSDKPYHIVADGYSSLLACAYEASPYAVDPANQRSLEAFVAQQEERNRATGGTFFDGDLVGVHTGSFFTEDRDLSFSAQCMKYSQHAGLFRTQHDAPIQALYVNGLFITQDNYLTFGTSQVSETANLGKLSLPAGGVAASPDGGVSLGADLFREASEEFGFAPEYHLGHNLILPGWINGASKRDGTYHLTASFIAPLRLTRQELHTWFEGWREAHERWMASAAERGEKIKLEFKDLSFLPNEAPYLLSFIEEQDRLGKQARIQGKSLDVVHEWALTYRCDVERLKESKQQGARLHLPQPLL